MGEVQFDSTIKPLFLLSTIFGLVPVSPFNKNKGQELFTTKCLYILWSLLWVVSIISFVSYNTYDELHSKSERNEVIKVSTNFYFWTMIFTCVTTYINNIIFRDKFPNIVSKLLEVDKGLVPNSTSRVYQEERTSALKDTLVILAAISIIKVLVSYATKTIHPISVSYYTFEAIILFIITLTIIQFKTWVKKLKQRLKIIIKILSKYSKPQQRTIISTSNKTAPFFEEMSHEQTDFMENSEEIDQLQRIYNDLYEAKELVMHLYGIPAVCQTMTVFLTCLFTLYWGIYAFNVKHNQLEASIYFVTCGYTFVLLAWVLLNCHLATGEAHSVIVCIEKMTKQINFPQQVERDLMKFVWQIKDMPIDFTPCGLFTLNLPFLCSIVSQICTYIIILIQFTN
ncbi:hypothetical protein L9F63_014809 [Diploptera punctata]|uniref:Gustatory receptor n=1 Tax=Diploptera punctata TaxID=6984 RepID=A0AAD8A6Z1_DIPPU|nr:hypothetical protein L9F63_014809 [Diploptera punctata]